ncbi:MAG TPA: adenylyl-sulfate kinase [Gammaproteobacteria bacterium]
MQGQKPENVFWQHDEISREERERLNGHKSAVLWFTGLSGAGKSTLARAVSRVLYTHGCQAVALDGDNVRHGLNVDLGFSREDREENIRRIAEVAKLFVDSGMIVLCAFISPFKSDRQSARKRFSQHEFIEIFCDAPLHVCENRDEKGLYKKARAGKISEFTGISSPYERPDDCELSLDTGALPVEECVTRIVDYLKRRSIIK